MAAGDSTDYRRVNALIERVRQRNPVAADYITQLVIQHRLGVIDRDIGLHIHAARVSQLFVWKATPQGWNYWESISNKVDFGQCLDPERSNLVAWAKCEDQRDRSTSFDQALAGACADRIIGETK